MSWGQYVVTGAEGFLGSTIVRELVSRGEDVIACVLNLDDTAALEGVDVPQVQCDVTRPTDLDRVLARVEPSTTVLIHTTGIISIKGKADPVLEAVNVGGATQVIEACRRWGVGRLTYVSSVHALPELAPGEIVTEVDYFDPAVVEGAYAKSKAEATARVFEADDLDRVIVHPSGIYGPNDLGRGHITQLIADLLQSKVPAVVKGGYDLVDVRDVTEATIAASDHGHNGACYIISGHDVPIAWLAAEVGRVGRVPVPRTLPMWIAKLGAPIMEKLAERRNVRPLYTAYSLYTLQSGARFSHELASETWGYEPRSPEQTIADTVAWLKQETEPAVPKRRRRRKLSMLKPRRRRQSACRAAKGS